MVANILGRNENRIAVVLEYCVADCSVSVHEAKLLYVNRVADLLLDYTIAYVYLQCVGCFDCRTIL